MNKTKKEKTKNPICISRTDLPLMLGCGQMTADKISIAAGARIKVGKRVIINLEKVQNYLNQISN